MRALTALLLVLIISASMLRSSSALAFDKQEMDSYVAEVTQLRDQGKITSVDRAKRMKAKFQTLKEYYDSFDEEHWSYFIFIASRRDQGMSAEEGNYLMSKKVNEIAAKRQQAASRPESIEYRRCYISCMDQKKNSNYNPFSDSQNSEWCGSQCAQFR